MLPIMSKESGKAHFVAVMSWTWEVEQGEVASSDCALVLGQRLVWWLTRMGLGVVLVL